MKKSSYYSVKQRKFIDVSGQSTTGQIIVKDFGLCSVPYLAETIDRALDKELQYGIHLGRTVKTSPDYNPHGTLKDDKEVHAQKPVSNDGKRTKRSRKKV